MGVPVILELRPAELEAIRAHAERAHPEECCGLLAGRLPADFGSPAARLSATESVPLENKAASYRTNRFTFDPLAQAKAERALEARGLAVLGVYHSHPDAPAWPSPYDLENAWPSYAYLIVSSGRGAGDARVWTLAADRRSFLEGTVQLKEDLCPS
ncbi:MAG: M67 family metallopeptidase [Elusimicrobia bacterium]|nr:M67 family metallopeptidase [Elusimicrobiota bacterium]